VGNCNSSSKNTQRKGEPEPSSTRGRNKIEGKPQGKKDSSLAGFVELRSKVYIKGGLCVDGNQEKTVKGMDSGGLGGRET